ncbi:uncharacterized protein HMPREF1541_04898 [Cyphellophora europaea CBS 101466]|uniref:Release factor glutamine methyltransferase N-terminal domain-containing protein n=1 Tax=Cyphellophora europaea (strain CBS 101466) TaxID=1220924 RepID=W2RVS2_CYPE1|nr:uncharacterized protein HMPREF1541_04898 [Cyphellophora europaea CBS 101466]ETN40621.1 hypothetical protein HMPREF1541_04898 [Cyphellophora europaea CBS 101466]
MPRLSASIVRHATRKSKFLAPLLNQTGDLNSAQNELRWLEQHANKSSLKPPPAQAAGLAVSPYELRDVKLSKLEALVRRRAAGEPLQYIIGDQPFGELEILCERNVLIPRVETEAYTERLVKELHHSIAIGEPRKGETGRTTLRVLDICTGSGAIALLLHQLLRRDSHPIFSVPTSTQETRSLPMDLQIMGLDLSMDAIRLARRNLDYNIEKGLLQSTAKDEVIFRDIDATKLGLVKGVCKQELANLAEPAPWNHQKRWDIVISNPPYVAPADYNLGGRTERSVRNYEPQMALVPPQAPDCRLHPGDTFYPHILRIARQVSAYLIVMEVGDSAQAKRVRDLVQQAQLKKGGTLRIETWYDDGTIVVNDHRQDRFKGDAPDVKAQPESSSSARAVLIWRDKWAARRQMMTGPLTEIRHFLPEDSEFSYQKLFKLARHQTYAERARYVKSGGNPRNFDRFAAILRHGKRQWQMGQRRTPPEVFPTRIRDAAKNTQKTPVTRTPTTKKKKPVTKLFETEKPLPMNVPTTETPT